jgi:hypothetical protein
VAIGNRLDNLASIFGQAVQRGFQFGLLEPATCRSFFSVEPST